MTQQELADSLSKISKELLLKEPFYGIYLIMLNKSWETRIQTACVGKHNINFKLMINPTFWETLSADHRKGLLKHELLHIAFNHLTAFDFSDKKLANIAMDLEINQYIDSEWLPEGGLVLSTFPELNLNVKAGSRYYYNQLRLAKEQKEKTGSSGSEALDKLLDEPDQSGHDSWEEFDTLSEAEKKLLEKQVQHVLKEAAESAAKRCGSIPGEIGNLIRIDEVAPPKFDWRGYIRRFAGVSTKIFTKKIRRKENRKFPDSPGLKIKMRQHMLLAIDTSGSVSNEEVQEFMSEIKHIHKCGVDVTIIQCDTQINSIEKYTGTLELTVKGRGGTSFDPVIEYFNENQKKFTSLVYFTDGECSTYLKPKGKILWVISQRSEMNSNLPGAVIKLEL